jgi:hypothetical protein
MADAASRSDAVVIHGPRGMHFEDEILSSWITSMAHRRTIFSPQF